MFGPHAGSGCLRGLATCVIIGELAHLRGAWTAITLTNNKREVVRQGWIILGPFYDPSW